MRLTKTQNTALQAVERGAVWDEEHTEYFQLHTGGARAHTIFDLEGDGLVKRGPEEKMEKISIYRYSLTDAGKKALEEGAEMSDKQNPMTDEELAAIQGRLTKATPGPWVHSQHGCYVILGYKPEKKRIDGYGADDHVCVLDDGDHHQYRSEDEQLANAALIAHAPDDISRLLAEVERLRGEVAQLAKETDWLVKILSHYTEDCPLKFSWVYEEKFPIPKIDGCDGSWPDDDYFDCSNPKPENCWREAARKAVEEKERHG